MTFELVLGFLAIGFGVYNLFSLKSQNKEIQRLKRNEVKEIESIEKEAEFHLTHNEKVFFTKLKK